MRRVVAAFGGNALAPPTARVCAHEEALHARAAVECLDPFFSPDVELLVTHGNGPQVGQQLLQAESSPGGTRSIPLDVCVAQTQGELGYLVAQALGAVLTRRRISRSVAAFVTQVVVDAADPAFARPTKAIGPALDGDQAADLRRRGVAIVDEPGRGLRRAVASPEPRSVVELELVRRLLSLGVVVVAAGGGGVPVVPAADGFRGIDAVVDKDLTAALLADALDADLLLLVTDVPCAYTGFATPAQAALERLSAGQARAMIAAREFGAGNMAPKIEACARFASVPGRRAVVCDAGGVSAALEGRGGTTVVSTR